MKWSNTLKQIVGILATNCLSVFDHSVRLALKGLILINELEVTLLQSHILSIIGTIYTSFLKKEEAVVRRCSVNMVLLKISQNAQMKYLFRSLCFWGLQPFLKKRASGTGIFLWILHFFSFTKHLFYRTLQWVLLQRSF